MHNTDPHEQAHRGSEALLGPDNMRSLYEHSLTQYSPNVAMQIRQIDRESLAFVSECVIERVASLPTTSILQNTASGITWGEAVQPDANNDIVKQAWIRRQQNLAGVVEHYKSQPRDEYWKFAVSSAYRENLLWGVLTKLDRHSRGIASASDSHINHLITRLPLSDEEAERFSSSWLNHIVTEAGKPAGQRPPIGHIDRFGLVYSGLCNVNRDGTPRQPIQGMEDCRTFESSKGKILRARQELAEREGNTRDADAIELIGQAFYDTIPQPDGTMLPRSLREMRKRELLSAEDMNHAILSQDTAYQVLRNRRKSHMPSAATAAAITIGIGVTTVAGAQPVAASPVADRPSVSRSNAAHIPDFSSLYATPSARAISSNALGNTGDSISYDLSSLTRTASTPDQLVSANAVAPDIFEAIAFTTTVNADAPQQTVAPRAINPAGETTPGTKAQGKSGEKASTVKPTLRDRVKRIIGSSGLSEATEQFLEGADADSQEVVKVNQALDAEVSRRITSFMDALRNQQMSQDDSLELTSYVAQIQAAMSSPSTLSNLSSEDKQDILHALGTGLEPIIDARAADVYTQLSADAYGHWKGFSEEEAHLLSSLIAGAELTAMPEDQVQALLDAAYETLTPPETEQPVLPPIITSPENPNIPIGQTPENNSQIKQWRAAIEKAANDNNWSADKTQFMRHMADSVLKHNGTMTQLAAIAGNVFGESGYDMNILEAGNHIGLGWVQYSFGRRDAYEAAAREAGLNPRRESDALAKFAAEYIVKESMKRDQRGNNAGEWEGFLKYKDPKKAAAYWQWNFERPRDRNIQSSRTDEAQSVYRQIRAADRNLRSANPNVTTSGANAKSRRYASTPIYSDGPTKMWHGIEMGNPFKQSLVSKVKVTANYDGYSRNFMLNHPSVAGHDGTDLAYNGIAQDNVEVLSVADGVIVQAGQYSNTPSGERIQVVVVYHGVVNGRKVFTNYEHVQKGIPVRVGQMVKRGQVIALVGSTGTTAGHLHLTAIDNDKDNNGRVGVTDPNFRQQTFPILQAIPGGYKKAG